MHIARHRLLMSIPACNSGNRQHTLLNRDYYMGFSLSPDLSARNSIIGPRACPGSDIGRGMIDRVITKNPCLICLSYRIYLRKIYRNH